MLDYIQVGDLGINRDQFLSKVNRKVGEGNWFWAFRLGKRLYSWEWGMHLYEDAYFVYFQKNIGDLKDLIEKYHNVYVINRYDVNAGLDYKRQDHQQDHYHDIAIRRCLLRFGLDFKGKDLLDLNRSVFCHKKIPFHLGGGSLKNWFDSNRFIAVAPEIEDKAKLAEILIK